MPHAQNKGLNSLKTVLFPHSWLPGEAIENLCAAFPALAICKPWFMDEGENRETDDYDTPIVRPPEAMRPPGDFLTLLAEYRLWIRQNPGYAYLPTQQNEMSTWEIRRSLRQNNDEASHLFQEETVLWHLILHLERELEESRAAANEMLLRAKEWQSPLAEALGEAAPRIGLLDDLPVYESPAIEENRLRQVMSAWFGLFGSSIPSDAVLLTMAPEILDFVTELFETESIPPRQEGDLLLHTIHLPGFSPGCRGEKDPISEGLSGKTMILANRHKTSG